MTAAKADNRREAIENKGVYLSRCTDVARSHDVNPGRAGEDFQPQASRDSSMALTNASDIPVLFSRQRQPKGEPLERIDARVKPETASWLRKLAGDSSIGIVLDHLRSIFPKQ